MAKYEKNSLDLALDPFYNDTNLHYLEKITGEIDNGKAQLSEHKLTEE